MRRHFVGHRGVGKTELLKRHAIFFKSIQHFDLDDEIKKYLNTSISNFFEIKGEKEFREVEKTVYQKICKENKEFVLAVGAGFDISVIDPKDEIIYVSRETDKDGRIFLNRPRLDAQLSPLTEYSVRYQDREPKFLKHSNFIYHMPEGIKEKSEIEEKILKKDFRLENVIYTVTVPDFVELGYLMKCFSSLELRTDILSNQMIEKIVSKFPNYPWLISFRNENNLSEMKVAWVDWDIDLNQQPLIFKNAVNKIFSSHEQNTTSAIQKLNKYKNQGHLKLCPFVDTFEDLKAGYQWQQEDKQNRSFLPRAPLGKWLWYRQLGYYIQKINFVRNYTQLADQPSVYQFLTLPKQRPQQWAAVIGSPIHFSRSCVQHEAFFQKQKTFISRIHIEKEDFKNQLSWLIELGLSYAAITSPLKEQAFEVCHSTSKQAAGLKSVNTLKMKNGKILGENTDLDGFVSLVEDSILKDHLKIVIWGGGGTLQMMKSIFPSAQCFSSQTGAERDHYATAIHDVDLLVWAAPRSEGAKFPSELWKIKQIVDLNYLENSMGLELAQKRNIKYISGIKMFEVQAQKQQEFWSQP